jgi:hypothetical protein
MKRTAIAAAYAPTGTTRIEETGASGAGRGGVTISCYENDVPAFIEAEMERIYGSLYSSLMQFRVYDNGRDTSTYIVRENGIVTTVLLFQQEGDKLRVVNEVFALGEKDINRFAHYVFATFPAVAVISFKAIDGNIERLDFPAQHYNVLEDIVIVLPESADAYHAQLSSSMRRHVKRYTRKIDEAKPDWQFKVYSRDEIDEATIRAVIELNRMRMAGKNKESGIDEKETTRLIKMARECGMIGVIVVDGKIRSGTLCFRIGANYFLNVIAHDPQYDEYWLGTLGCYLTARECIARGGKEFHLLWGRYNYKFMLAGVQRDLNNAVIYRSRAQMWRHAGVVLGAWRQSALRKLNLLLHDAKDNDSVAAKGALGLLHWLRAVKHAMRG